MATFRALLLFLGQQRSKARKWVTAAPYADPIALDNVAATQSVVARILPAVAQFAEQPPMERPGRVPGTRELVVLKTRYIVPDRMQGEVISILRVFHTSRRLPKRW